MVRVGSASSKSAVMGPKRQILQFLGLVMILNGVLTDFLPHVAEEEGRVNKREIGFVSRVKPRSVPSAQTSNESFITKETASKDPSGIPSTLHQSSSPCSDFQWKCHGREGKCIDMSQRCDNITDCSDASDEFGCHCDLSRFFRCSDNECISKSFVCDGSPDCADQSDEENCNGNKESCIFGNFRCKNGHCIPFGWKCDGSPDCPDNSDEENCLNRPHCTASEYRCRSQLCISKEYLCDGEIDCKDGDDEENCTSQCKGGDCLQECSNSTNSHCLCPKGHTLLPEGKTCKDIDECAFNISECDHFCANQAGGFECTCAPGYRLRSDNRTCLHTSNERGFLLIAKNEEIRELKLGSTLYMEIFIGETAIKSISYDPVEDKVYWSNEVGVFKKDRQNNWLPTLVVRDGIQQAESIAVDWYGRNLYIADSRANAIVVCTLTGLRCKDLLVVRDIRVIQLDMKNRLLFWVAERNKIEKAGMDGSQRRTLIEGYQIGPNALALDPPALRVYWMNSNLSKVEHVNYDGGDRKHLPDGAVLQPVSMAVWENRLYWSDLRHHYINSCSKRNGKDVQVVLKSATNDLTAIMIYHSAMREQGKNPCRIQPCTHMCLLSPRSYSGYTCACPIGMELSDNMHTCKEQVGTSYPLIADGNKFYKVIGGTIGQIALLRWDIGFRFERIGDMAYDPLEGCVIVSDPFAKIIVKIHLDTARVSHIVSDVIAVSVGVDWLRKNFYWVDKMKRKIEVINRFGLYRKAFSNPIENPIDIAVSPNDGFMFIIDASSNPSIVRCDLDGNSCTRIVGSRMTLPVSIAVDIKSVNKRVYWCDLQGGQIESTSFDGTGRNVEKEKLQRPVSLIVTDGYLMWTVEGLSHLYKSVMQTKVTAPHILRLGTSDYGVRVLQLQNVGWIVGESSADLPCLHGNISCNQLCLGNSTHKEVCACGVGYELAENGYTCVPYACRNNQFLCPRNKTCIPLDWKCDGTPDCSDGGDEENCNIRPSTCPVGDFRCNSGNCINIKWLCDRHRDCPDGEDELLPKCGNTSCSSNQFQCKSGECIPSMWRCDKIPECGDRSDEEDCPLTCGEHKFLCNDGDCISDMWHCDGAEDCKDGSDEIGCEDTTERVINAAFRKCTESEIMCDTRNGSIICISERMRCDGVMDCPLGDDENCTKCEASQFKCATGDRCIPVMWLCDGYMDCLDGSDENQDCPESSSQVTTTSTTTTETTTRNWKCHIDEYSCYNGQCILGSKVCDGQADCGDGSDEYNHCYQTCEKENGGCQHKCRSTPEGRTCSCNSGFFLHSDGSSCLDIRECDDEATCSHFCEELRGSYICFCMDGYQLEPDRRSCKSMANKEWTLLLGSGNILNMSVNLHVASKIPSKESTQFSSVSFDPAKNGIVYTDADKGIVGMMTLKMENSEPLVEKILSNRHNPQGISIDHGTGNFYFSEYFVDPLSMKFSESGNGSTKREQPAFQNIFSVIQMCNMGKVMCSQIYRVINVKIPSTQVAANTKKLFYCNNHLSHENQAEIMISDLDGGSRESLHQHKMVHCGTLALDEPKRKVYWTDMALNTVESIGFDGGNHQIFRLNEAHHPVGLAVTGDWLMWFNLHGSQLVMCNKYNSKCRMKSLSLDTSEKFKSSSLLVTHPQRQSEDICTFKNCSQLCTIVNNEATCMCQTSYRRFPDEFSCVKVNSCKYNPCGAGICELLSSRHYVCRCPSGFEGLHCEVQIGLVELANNTGTVVAVVIILLAILGIVIGVTWYKNQPFFIWKAKGRRANQTYRFSNPAFGVLSDTAIMTNSPAPSSSASIDAPPYRGVNPQKSHSNFENPFFKADDHQANTSLDSAVVSGTDSTSISIAPHQINLESPNVMQEQSTNEKKEWILSPYNPPPLESGAHTNL